MRHQSPLVFSLIDYEQAFDSANRRAKLKALSFYGIPDKYIKMIIAIMGLHSFFSGGGGAANCVMKDGVGEGLRLHQQFTRP